MMPYRRGKSEINPSKNKEEGPSDAGHKKKEMAMHLNCASKY
jgi:hypothetical protein